MLSGIFDYLINAPIDISFIVIVIGASVLGSTLHLMYNHINPEEATRKIVEPGSRYHYVVEYIMVGVVVSLLFYILSRTALISLMDRSVADDSFSLNPLVAFIAALAGILSNETFKRIVKVGANSIDGEQSAAEGRIPVVAKGPKTRKRAAEKR